MRTGIEMIFSAKASGPINNCPEPRVMDFSGICYGVLVFLSSVFMDVTLYVPIFGININ